MIVALLAIAKAGGVYVPLDAGFPAERLRLMLSEVGAGLVLTAGATTGRIPAGTWQVVDLDAVELPEEERNPDAGVGCFVAASTSRP